jgi:hypothetical protein
VAAALAMMTAIKVVTIRAVRRVGLRAAVGAHLQAVAGAAIWMTRFRSDDQSSCACHAGA